MAGKHNSASKKNTVFATIVRIFAIITFLVMVAGTVYISSTRLFPTNYILIIFAAVCVISALLLWLVLSRKRVLARQIISLILCIVVLAVSGYSTSLLGAVHGSLSNMPSDENGVSAEAVNVSAEPFLVYLSGLDTKNSDEIKDKGLSDVNMIVAVNPETHKILMVSVPRDYYVPLWGDENKMDKLTHAGNYGVECSMDTLESLFDVEFNYYVKVNFKSVVDIVDAVGGVTVNSEFDFSSYHSLSGKTYYFKKGENTLTGDAALAFARERYSFSNGDRQRGIHQQMVISAIFDKAISPSILNPSHVNELLDAVIQNMKSNITYDEITELVQLQLAKMPSWDIDTMSVDGTGATLSTYSTGGQALSVMKPNQETIDAAKAAIEEVMK